MALSVEDRLALLEQRLGVVGPLATVPPITIGELTNVPAPGSQIAAQWAQDVSSRIVQRFATTAALKAWAAPNGAYAVALDTNVLWRRIVNVWSQATPWTGSATGIAVAGTVHDVPQPLATFNIPSDPGPRVAAVSSVLKFDLYYDRSLRISLTVDGGVVAEAIIPRYGVNTAVATENIGWNVCLAASDVIVPAGRAIPVTMSVTAIDVGAINDQQYHTFAVKQYNRVDATVFPKGY